MAHTKQIFMNMKIWTQWVASYIKNDEVTYFDSFGGKNEQKESEKVKGKNNKTNILRIQIFLLISFMLKKVSRFYQSIFT